MKSRSRPRAIRVGLALLTAVAVSGLATVPATAGTPSDAVAATAAPSGAVPTSLAEGQIQIVDPDATPETRSLFQYLRDVRGEGILFGHQHTTSYGVTFPAAEADGYRSDVLEGIGDHPAVFGWDTLIIEGRERPGSTSNSRAENVAVFAEYIEKAHEVGGINTISVHMENFVTGGDFYDTSGDTLRAVLPGGDKHDELRAYLDDIALLAHSVEDGDGNAIPIIFRPWHENAGSWFWWGASYGTPGEYKELFRFTVEYLRDVKDVHNFLYAFSPGGGFGGSEDLYLRTYPGDAYIDILGYDSYDNGNAGTQWLTQITRDLAMLADLADERGKVSAFTEYGVSTGALKPNGQNANLAWFTTVLDAIKADPKASRSAYMATWANFGLEQFFVPYPATGSEPEHELLPDFRAFAEDAFSYFADDVTGVYDNDVTAVAHEPLIHLVSPADGARVATSPTTVRARVLGLEADAVTFRAGEATAELTLDEDGFWWSGQWDIPASALDNSTLGVTVEAMTGDAVVLSDTASVVLGPTPVFPAGMVDDFEGYGDDTALRSEYSQVGANTISLETGVVGQGAQAMRIDVDFAAQEYAGVGKQVGGDWSPFGALSLWLDPDGSDNLLVLQLQAGGVSYEAYPSLAGTEPYEITIPWGDWRPAPWDTANAHRRISSSDLADVRQFFVYINSADDAAATSTSIAVDNIRATGEAPGFVDVPRSHNFHREIMWMLETGISTGYTDGTYRPRAPVSRQHMAAFIHRYAGADHTHEGSPTFSDVSPAHIFFHEIEWMAAEGLSGGYTDGTYRPRRDVTRAQMTAFLHRYYGAPEPTSAAPFSDIPADHPFADAIAWAHEVGVVGGYSDGTFRPGAPVSRQHMAAFLYRYDRVPPPVPESVTLFDFEAGTQGWTGAGTVTAADGALAITSTDGWFGVDQGGVDLTGRTTLSFDLLSQGAGTSFNYALKLGPDWTWCEGTSWVWTPQESAPTTVNLDLTELSAECQAHLADFRGIQVFFNAGEFVIDDVRVS